METNSNYISRLTIKNFKSIKNLEIEPARINIFIGKPNVGKSNILEAMSLFSANYGIGGNALFKDYIRFSKTEDLFYDNEILNDIIVSFDDLYTQFAFSKDEDGFYLYSDYKDDFFNNINKYRNSIDLYNTINNGGLTPNKRMIAFDKLGDYSRYTAHSEFKLRYYKYIDVKEYSYREHRFLLPPFGENLYTMIQHNKEIHKYINTILSEYNLKFVLKKSESKFEIQKNIDDVIYSFPYSSIADTLKRFIFYYTAIKTNDNSVILFEEPENFSYPGYIKEIAHEIIESESNQFFLTTHSPFILNTILDDAPADQVKIFLMDYKDYQTTCRELTEEELASYYEYGSDLLLHLPFKS